MTSFDIYAHINHEQIENFEPTFLYLKQHRKTGMFYFGKSRLKYDKFLSYNGSGTHWKRHIKKHGTDIETLWYCLFTDYNTLIETALSLSESMDVVNNLNFANIKNENGLNGGGHRGLKFSRNRENWPEEVVIKHKSTSSSGGKIAAENKLGCHDLSKIDAKQRSINSAKSSLLNGTNNLKNNNSKYKEKRMASFKNNGGNHGERNPAFGTKLLHHSEHGNKRVKLENVQEFLDSGWKFGSLEKFKRANPHFV